MNKQVDVWENFISIDVIQAISFVRSQWRSKPGLTQKLPKS
ncbi:hypothetical protein [Nostoc sp. UHCC 0252]|nr:hypothetical protein [Nostoc sp. UHCC 0252]MEA5605821.1 hypothetical protein [Nostoc sp. UHCC 0252]